MLIQCTNFIKLAFSLYKYANFNIKTMISLIFIQIIKMSYPVYL